MLSKSYSLIFHYEERSTTMKKIISVLLTLCFVCAALASLTSCTQNDADGDTIYVGVYEPASGSNGAGGKQETLGVKYANSIKNTVTVGGKTYRVELVIVDNESNDDKAISAATQLINKNVSIVLGSYGSSVSIAAADTFKDAHLPAIGITCTNPKVTSDSDYYFRACFLDPFQGTVLANFAKDKGIQKAYVLAEQGNAYDVGLASYFKTAFGTEGVDYKYETFQKGNSDFSSYIESAINFGATAIFAPTSVEYATLIIDTAKAKNFRGMMLAGDTWDSNKIVEAATGSTLDIEVTTFYQEGASKEFDEGFVNWMKADKERITENGGNTMISAVSTMGYDAYMTALYAIEHAVVEEGKMPTRDQIRDALAAMNSVEKSYAGVTGAIYFDTTGDAVRESAFIKKVDTDNGAWIFVKEQKAQ